MFYDTFFFYQGLKSIVAKSASFRACIFYRWKVLILNGSCQKIGIVRLDLISTRVLSSTQKVTAHVKTVVGAIHIRVPVFFGTFFAKISEAAVGCSSQNLYSGCIHGRWLRRKMRHTFCITASPGVSGGREPEVAIQYDLETCDHAVTNDTDLQKHAVEYDGTLASSNDPFNHIFQGIHQIFFQ